MSTQISATSTISHAPSGIHDGSSTASSDDEGSSCSMSSPIAPPYSPIGGSESTSVTSEMACTTEEESESESTIVEASGTIMEDGANVTMEESRNSWCGFKLVGDNIDKNVRPTHQCLDHQTKSLHYFHAYAVVDRIDLCELSDATPERPDIDPSTLLHAYNQ